jgi:ribosome-binding protein aMBF1 (putative translation factor)
VGNKVLTRSADVCYRSHKIEMKLKTQSVTESKINHLATGEMFRREREKQGASLRAVAKAADLSAAFLSDLERGRRAWTEDNFDKLTKALNSLI